MKINFLACDIPFQVVAEDSLRQHTFALLSGYVTEQRPLYTLLMDHRAGNSLSKDNLDRSISFDARRDLIDFRGFDGQTIKVVLKTCHHEAVSAALGYLLAAVLPLHDGMLLHASAVLGSKGACVFPGKSGAGKSTIAKNSSMTLIHEDRVAVRRKKDGWVAYGLPMVDNDGYPGKNINAPIRMLGLLRKSDHERLIPEKKRYALEELLQNVVLPKGKGLDPARTSLVCMDLVNDLPVFEVYFKKGSDVAELL